MVRIRAIFAKVSKCSANSLFTTLFVQKLPSVYVLSGLELAVEASQPIKNHQPSLFADVFSQERSQSLDLGQHKNIQTKGYSINNLILNLINEYFF